jgi:beta-lactamase regulating signal transducer with metallopeptidase domain
MGYKLIINIILSSSIMAGLLIILIVMVKSIFRNKLGARWHYWIWFLLLLRLIMPNLGYSFNVPNIFHSSAIENNAKLNDIGGSPQNLNPSNDQAGAGEQVEKFEPATPKKEFWLTSQFDRLKETLYNLKIDFSMIFIIWIIGAFIFCAYAFTYNVFFWARVKNGSAFTDQKIIQLLEECKQQLGIRTNVSIIRTSGIRIPAIYGVTRPWIMIPETVLENLGHEGLRYVILHELAHLKRKDILVNWIVLILHIIHWFNPLVWYAFGKMRTDRELACDAEVLSHLDPGEERKYGSTILDMVQLNFKGPGYAGMAGILENKSKIKDRILMISHFNGNSNKISLLMMAVIALLSCTVLLQANFINVKATQDKTAENVQTSANIVIATPEISMPITTNMPEITNTPVTTPKPVILI